MSSEIKIEVRGPDQAWVVLDGVGVYGPASPFECGKVLYAVNKTYAAGLAQRDGWVSVGERLLPVLRGLRNDLRDVPDDYVAPHFRSMLDRVCQCPSAENFAALFEWATESPLPPKGE